MSSAAWRFLSQPKREVKRIPAAHRAGRNVPLARPSTPKAYPYGYAFPKRGRHGHWSVVAGGRDDHVWCREEFDGRHQPSGPLGKRLHDEGRERGQLVSAEPGAVARTDRAGGRPQQLSHHRYWRRRFAAG